ncbi:hypothetical protein [Burkholderia gladioli]|uniref:hypothetical protein n=1 Tax=Burkholderia gladioli TaxID=28095 RepID=UPI00163E01F3|nr:hypothetical protein [Burkholderia gladioli]
MDNILAVIGAFSLIGIGIAAVCYSGIGALRKTSGAERQTPSRGRRVLGTTWRYGRIGLEVLGGIFIYFCALGYAQYLDQQSAQQLACAVARCM